MDYEKRLTEYGHMFSAEFIGALADHCEQALHDWLKANGAPPQVNELISDSILLERAALHIQHHELTDWDARCLVEDIPYMTARIAEIGGEFHSPVGTTRPRENIITWEGARAWRNQPASSESTVN